MFEVDTGSYASTLRVRDAKLAGVSVLPTAEKALAYGGASIDLVGECFIPVKLGKVEYSHKFLVVKCKEVNLCGRDLCALFNIQFSTPSGVNLINTVLKLQMFCVNTPII